MNERIQQFLNVKGLSASEFADRIGVQRSNVTHVLHGRNKPSFQFIEKMMKEFPEINAKWLILGEGEIVGGGVVANEQQSKKEAGIWDQPDFQLAQKTLEPEVQNRPVGNDSQQSEGREKSHVFTAISQSSKPIERIVVFYSDQTFSQYTPSN